MGESSSPWLRLLRARGLRNSEALTLLDRFGTATAVCDASGSAWQSAGVNRAGIALPADDDAGVRADLDWLAASPNRHLVTLHDPRYPELLKSIPQPPLALFVAGDAGLLAAPQIAIVGARAATPQGLENAASFAAALVERGLVVTSGLATGVDGAAHLGALDAARAGAPASTGATLAVCGTGLDRVYPARHKALAHRIVSEGGALVSEFCTGTASVAANFPRRNRIISGLSLGVLVVEASRDSGSLITARRALDQNREVFAIPGSIHNPLAKGCHQLIREGAKLVEQVDDILLELAPRLGAWLRSAPAGAGAKPESPTAPGLQGDAARVLAALDDRAKPVDAVIAATGLSPAAVSAALLELELAGSVAMAAGGQVMRLQRA